MEKYFPWFGLFLLIGAFGCDINHTLSGDAYVHVLAEADCEMIESEGQKVITCIDGRQLVCVETEVLGTFVCQSL